MKFHFLSTQNPIYFLYFVNVSQSKVQTWTLFWWRSKGCCGGVTVALRRVAGRAGSSWTSSCESPTRWPWTCTNVWATASTGRWSSTTPPATASLTKTRTVSPRTQSVYGEKLEKFRCFQIQKSKAWALVLPQKCNFFVRMSQTPHYLWTWFVIIAEFMSII